MKSELPNQLLPYAALAWLRMEKRAYPAAIHELTSMINKIPKPAGAAAAQPPLAPDPFEWAGQLREYAEGVGDRRGN